MEEQTQNVIDFIAANAESDVIDSRGTDGQTVYRLVDGRTFVLTTDEIKTMPEPLWFGMHPD